MMGTVSWNYPRRRIVMRRRDLFRQSACAALAAAARPVIPVHGREIPADYDASVRLRRPDWQPVFLTAHQSRTLEALADLIIPETETPGAGAALVHRFLDQLLAAETPGVQADFLAALASVDGLSRDRYGRVFVYLEPSEQGDLLSLLAYPQRLVTWGGNRSEFGGHLHFVRLKDWISRAYYSSEEGLRELGFEEAMTHGDFLGCGEEANHRRH
jgi:gluconate 2-dehydrogenase gamma chain